MVKDKNRALIVGIIIVLVAVFGGYCLSQPQKGYLYFEGEYYRAIGAAYSAEGYADKEPLGEVKRDIMRGFWNKSGDTNCYAPGAKIYEGPDGNLAVEGVLTDVETGESRLLYWAAEPEK